jgi:hypothetical protein
LATRAHRRIPFGVLALSGGCAAILVACGGPASTVDGGGGTDSGGMDSGTVSDPDSGGTDANVAPDAYVACALEPRWAQSIKPGSPSPTSTTAAECWEARRWGRRSRS